MKTDREKACEMLFRLADEEVEDVLAASDKDISQEILDIGGNADDVAAQLRSLFEISRSAVAKRKLIAAKEAARNELLTNQISSTIAFGNLRALITNLLNGDSAQNQMVAARKENNLSENDLRGIAEDLHDLGLLKQDPKK